MNQWISAEMGNAYKGWVHDIHNIISGYNPQYFFLFNRFISYYRPEWSD